MHHSLPEYYRMCLFNRILQQNISTDNTYQSLPLEQRCLSIKHKYGSDAEEEKFAKAVKQSEKMCILYCVAITISYTLQCLV